MNSFPQVGVTRGDNGQCVYDFSQYRNLIGSAWCDSLQRYCNEGIEPGGALKAILENDFMGAIGRFEISEENCRKLHFLRQALLEGVPDSSWGSKQAVEKWLDRWR